MKLDILVSSKILKEGARIIEDSGHEPAKNCKLSELTKMIANSHFGAQAQETRLRSSLIVSTRIVEALEKAPR